MINPKGGTGLGPGLWPGSDPGPGTDLGPGPETTQNRDFAVVLTPWQQMLSSGAGALVVSLTMTPLDVVKIRLQSQERLYAKKCFLYSNGLMDHLCPRTNGDPPQRQIHTIQQICDCKWYNRPKYFNSTTDAFIKIARTEGLSSLWSGLVPTLVLALPTTVVYFTMYEQLKVKIETWRAGSKSKSEDTSRNDGESQAVSPRWVSLASGGLARWIAVTIVNPLELVRTKMMSQKMRVWEVRACLRELLQAQGIRGLWNGYTMTLMRDVPFSAIYWPLYEQTGHSLAELYPLYPANSFPITFASGAVAGSIASTLTLPFDVVKTLKQLDMGERQMGGGQHGQGPKGNLAIVRELVREQGVKSLFTGLVPRLLKVAPACAIMISSYEWCKAIFKQQNLEL